MSQKTYIANNESLKSYVDLNYLDLAEHESIWKNIVDLHPFNQTLALFLPACSINLATENFGQQLSFYYEVEAPLSILLDPQFFSTFIQSDHHQLTMHSIDTDLNTDNVVVLDASGVLSLSLTKDTYEKFGIQVEHRSKAAIKHNKYIVNIPLKGENFCPGSKQFERLKWCFENTLSQPFKLVFSAADKLTKIPIDIKWPNQTKSVTKKNIEPQFETLTDIQIPSFEGIRCPLNQEQKEDWDKHVMNAAEWVGLAYSKSSRIQQSVKTTDPFVSIYRAPSPFLENTTGTLIKWKGFITTDFIHNVMTITRKLMISNSLNEWTSLSAWGYRDSPYTWGKKEHYSYLNGENDFTFLLIPQHQTAYTIQFYGSHHSNV